MIRRIFREYLDLEVLQAHWKSMKKRNAFDDKNSILDFQNDFGMNLW